ncbi:uncharacterized protein RHIMIDRAFT_261842 [Rhizopus microsporus ATCC 52813]|uniref:Uncharacterized protein n=1 Tax=Rhizopus microsporus ATCC 52813 TaxID=1340429 RepID=A0A2G4SLG7_RHIZD|nr:uncharacterized protein RHIMIDRAFT_261842 [Rhizopus microsporus ATCC 52813]PHZ09604.1 hypothetical protein RHIMIDRAFT_261842 [Rhizopus microsporus ATCC 52813]
MTQPKEQDEQDVIEEFTRQIEEVVQIDSDNESTISFGYQLLPQDDDEEEEEMKEAMEIELDPKDELDAKTCDFIKSIMSRIELKEEAIPDWAKTIPESAWMPKIVKK